MFKLNLEKAEEPAFLHTMRGAIPPNAPNAAKIKTAEKNLDAFILKCIANLILNTETELPGNGFYRLDSGKISIHTLSFESPVALNAA